MPIPTAVHQFILSQFRFSLMIVLLSWKNPLGKVYKSEPGNELKSYMDHSIDPFVSSTLSWFTSNVNTVTGSFYKGHENLALTSLCYPPSFP